MAKEKVAEVTKNESEQIKPVILRDQTNGEIYVLEFNRDTVKFAEQRGFKIGSIDAGVVVTTTEDLFYYAFRMHHPKMSKADTDKILYDKLHGMPDGMLLRLIDLYVLPIETLKQKEEEAKNLTMTVEF